MESVWTLAFGVQTAPAIRFAGSAGFCRRNQLYEEGTKVCTTALKPSNAGNL